MFIKFLLLEAQLVEIPEAESVYNTQSMSLPPTISSFVILIPNEAHESWSDEKHKLLTDSNSYFVPTNLIIPQGASISFLNADAPWDTPHPHTINVKDSSGDVVYTTELMDYADESGSKNLPAGDYSIIDTKYDWMNGSIKITDEKSTGNSVVGAFYVPTNEVLNNTDNDGEVSRIARLL
jgi:hypothetical protein